MVKYRSEWANVPIKSKSAKYLKQLSNKREQWEWWCEYTSQKYDSATTEPLPPQFFNLERIKARENGWHPLLDYRQAFKDIIDGLVYRFGLEDKKLVTLDLGCLAGKWTQLLSEYSKEVICVDVFDYGFKIIRERHKDIDCELSFYLTSGDELTGIKDNSVDLIFSIDSINKDLPAGVYEAYFKEFSRVLSPWGFALIHLPKRLPEGKITQIPDYEGGFFNLKKSCEINKLTLVGIDDLELSNGEIFCIKKNL